MRRRWIVSSTVGIIQSASTKWAQNASILEGARYRFLSLRQHEGGDILRGSSHIVISAAASVLICKQLGLGTDIASVAISVIAAIVPDADTEKSTINKYLPVGKLSYMVLAVALFYKAWTTGSVVLALAAAISLIIFLSRHRGITHSIAASLVLGVPLYFNLSYWISFIVSYNVHLLCDMFNTKGVLLLYPFSKARARFPIHFPMESLVGRAVELGLVIGSALILINHMKYYLRG